MQRLLLTCMMIMLPFIIHANNFITIPYTPVIGDSVTMAQNEQCDTDAQFGASSFKEARGNTSLVELLAHWDAYELTAKGQKFSRVELARYKALANMSWLIADRYPNLTSEEYGDEVFDACVKSKITTLVEI